MRSAPTGLAWGRCENRNGGGKPPPYGVVGAMKNGSRLQADDSRDGSYHNIIYYASCSASAANSAAGRRRPSSSKAISVACDLVYLRISRIRYLSESVIKV